MQTDMGGRYGAVPALTLGGTVNVDLAQAANDNLRINMVLNSTFTLVNGIPGAKYTLLLVQDATGSRTGAWASNVKWKSSAPTLTTTASHGDIVSFLFDGVNFIECFRNLDVGVV